MHGVGSIISQVLRAAEFTIMMIRIELADCDIRVEDWLKIENADKSVK